ncbi:MAG: RNA ligase family protein, partial [Clostridia bacterium]
LFLNICNSVNKRIDKILEYLPNGYVLYGEWLNQGKINYNSLAKQGKIEPYYAFDLVKELVNKPTEDEDFTRIFASIEEMKNIANEIGLKTVPELAIESLTSYEELKQKYVDNQKSALEGTDCIREGIVIKTLDGERRIKIVGDKFQEVKHIKNSETKSPYSFLDKYITPMRICKFLTTLGIENPKPEDYREIFKNLDIIANDILEEEKEQILKDITRIIKKQAIPNIKEYVEVDKS